MITIPDILVGIIIAAEIIWLIVACILDNKNPKHHEDDVNMW